MEFRSVQAKRLTMVGLCLGAAVALMVGCGGGGGGDGFAVGPAGSAGFQSPAINASPSPISEKVFYSTLAVASSTVPIGTSTALLIRKASADGATLRLPDDPAFATLAEGSILVAPITPEFPEGLVRYVTRLVAAGSEKVVETRPAAFAEVFAAGELGLARFLEAAEVTGVTAIAEYDPEEVFARDETGPAPSVRPSAPSGVDPRFLEPSSSGRLRAGSAGFGPALRQAGAGSGLRFEINKILYDRDFDPNTRGDQFRVSARLNLDPRIMLGCQIENGRMTRGLFKTSIEIDQSVALASDLALEYNKFFELGRIRLNRFIMGYAGEIPIWVTPEIPLVLFVQGNVKPNLYASMTSRLSVVGGVQIEAGQPALIKDLRQASTHEADEPYEPLDIRVIIRPTLELRVEGSRGPKLELDLSSRLRVAPQSTTALDLTLGVRGRVGFDLPLFGKEWQGGEWGLHDWSQSVWQKPGPVVTVPYDPADPAKPILMPPTGFTPETITTISGGSGPLIADPASIEMGQGLRMLMQRLDAQTFTLGGTAQPNAFAATLSKPFWIGRYEVTQAQYRLIMGGNPAAVKPAESGDLASWPVQNVSWYDALSFCNRLSANVGLRPCYRDANGTIVFDPAADGFRLPTEAEWELAAREEATDQQFDQQGPAGWDAIAWFWGNVPSTTATSLGKGPQPVGRKRANANGVYDMRGNVAEWCWDYHAPYPGTAQTDPRGPTTGIYRVIRGGAWDARSVNLAVLHRTARDAGGPTARNFSTGFRVARNAQ